MSLFTILCSAVLVGMVVPAWSDKHSLYYIYTALSKPVDLPGIYEFTAMGLLDDRQIDYYNSKEKRKVPTQHWMKEKMQEDYWEKGTQSRKSKEQWFNVNVNILMNRMRHNESDVHVLQWRHGCEIEQQGNDLKFSKGIDEYSYDGENFLSFDDKESQWVAPVDAAVQTKRKWDNVPILNQYTKGYLEKECVDWLNKFREYGDKELRNGSPPDVLLFAKKSTSDKTKLKLTCMATGFYPKDIMLIIRKYRTSLPEAEIESTGVRPSHNGTFQLRKSVDIKEDEKAEYDCFVSHSTLKEPIIVKWDGLCRNCPPETLVGMIGAVIGGLLVLAVVALVVFILIKKNIIVLQNPCKSKKVHESKTDENKKFLPAPSVHVLIPGANNRSDSDATRTQGEGEGHDKTSTGSRSSLSSDSGKGSDGASRDNSPTNSQESVCEESSGKRMTAESKGLLPQDKP